MPTSVIPENAAAAQGKGRSASRFGRWRAMSLILVYVLMAVHVLHWRLSGKTLAPLEFNEVMYTAELGIVTAGFLFMLGAVVATAIFGRFFCSWGCHILALQDLCHWLLAKLRIRPKAVRSRLLLWIPLVVAGYMFVWPQVYRLWLAAPQPVLHTTTDAQGWASFVTTNFWRNLPSPAITVLTFLSCGFAIVYVLGSRSFCTYGCPYGAVFALADRVAPGRIRLRANDCQGCGTCTAACQSNVRVHEELARFGMVVNPACLKDLDCVSVCPRGAVHFGFGRPALAAPLREDVVVRRAYDFTLGEDAIMIGAFLATLVIFRGLYDLIPFFMSLALGIMSAYAVCVTWRLLDRPLVHFNRIVLKAEGRLSAAGRGFAVGAFAWFVFTAHSAYIQYETRVGRREFLSALAAPSPPEAGIERAIAHLTSVERWGLLSADRNRWLLSQGHYQLAGSAFKTGNDAAADAHLRRALGFRPEYPEAEFDLGALLVRQGDLPEAMNHLLRSLELRPDFAEAHYNLGVAQAMSGDCEHALPSIKRSLELRPADAQAAQFLEMLTSMCSGATGASSARRTSTGTP